MSDDEKDVLIGKAVEEYTDALTHAAALTAALMEMGKEFEQLARQLTTEPAKLAEGARAGGVTHLNVAKALDMAGQLRDALAEVEAHERKLNHLGVPLQR